MSVIIMSDNVVRAQTQSRDLSELRPVDYSAFSPQVHVQIYLTADMRVAGIVVEIPEQALPAHRSELANPNHTEKLFTS